MRGLELTPFSGRKYEYVDRNPRQRPPKATANRHGAVQMRLKVLRREVALSDDCEVNVRAGPGSPLRLGAKEVRLPGGQSRQFTRNERQVAIGEGHGDDFKTRNLTRNPAELKSGV